MFTKVYTDVNTYRVYQNAEGRYVAEGQPEYVAFLYNGGIPAVTIDASVIDILEIVDGVVQYKSDKDATLLAKAKTLAKNTLASNRFIKEISGMTINGALIHTDRESQAMLNAAYVMATTGNLESGTIWKGADGWHTLAKADILALSVAVKDFVEALFVAEKAKYDLIEAATTVEEVNAIDLTF